MTLLYATRGFTTGAGDLPPHTNVARRLEPFTVRRAIPLPSTGTEGLGGVVATSGEILLDNADGGLDHLDRHSVARRTLTLKAAPFVANADGREPILRVAEFNTVATLKMAGWNWTTKGIRIKLRENELSIPVTNRGTYDGVTEYTGGTEEMEGEEHPLGFGFIRNATPRLISQPHLLYQISTARIAKIDQVRDGGVKLGLFSDYATPLQLIKAPVPRAKAATCLRYGLFKLGWLPEREVTVDFYGDGSFADNETKLTATNGKKASSGAGTFYFVPDNARPYAGWLGSVVRRIITNFGKLTAANLDLSSFGSFNAAFPHDVGWYIPAGEPVNAVEILDVLLKSAGAILYQRPDGRWAIRQIVVPTGGTPLALNRRRIVDIERLDPPMERPVTHFMVGYNRNFTVMNASSMAPIEGTDPGADPDDAAVPEATWRGFAQRDQSWVTRIDELALAAAGGEKNELRAQGFFRFKEGALAGADVMKDLLGKARGHYRIAARSVPYEMELGDPVRLTHDRFGLSTTRYGVVTSVEETGKRTTVTVLA